MNSTTFMYRHSDEPDAQTFERVKLIRLGLCFGLKRSEIATDLAPKVKVLQNLYGEGSGREWDGTVGARHHALMSECPERCKLRVHLKFLAKNHESLEFATQHASPWYVPTCFGGVGLQPLPQFGFVPSETDRLIVTAMLNPTAWHSGLSQFLFPKKINSAQEKVTHQIAMKEIRRLIGEAPKRWVPEGTSTGVVEPRLVDSWSIYQRWEENLLELENGGLDELWRQVRHNEKTWRWYLKHIQRFGWMHPLLELPKFRLIDDVNLTERRVALLPTPLDTEISSMEEILYGHNQMAETESDSRVSRAFADTQFLRVFMNESWDPFQQTMRVSAEAYV